MIHERFHRPLIYAGLAVVLAVQFSFYFTGNVITGWDTLGHLHLAREYARLFPWESTGFDSVWFQGFPAFYFYPPFFYFAVNALSTLTTLTITAAFNVGIFLIILFFAFSFVRLGVKLFPQHITSSEAHWAAAAGSLFYLTFPGDGLQGTSAVGVLSGTFVSTLGHAMILQMLSGLLQFRGSKKNLNLFSSAAWFSLTLYTHGLSSFFGGVLLVLFVLYFHRDFRPRHIALLFGLPVLMALPIILRFLLRSHYTSGSPYSAYYPVLLSILGTDFFKAVSTHDVRTIVQNVIFGWKTPIFAFVLLYGWGILRSPRGSLKPEARWILLTGFLFFWAALDNSLVYILPRFPVHWYRAFDYFLISLAMIGSVMIPECRAFLPRWLGPHAGAAAAALLALRLLSWDIAGHQSYQSVLFDDYAGRDDLSLVRSHLQSLPKNSLFLPELIREKEYHGSPHALLHIVEEAGHRNILGLTVESSLTPNVTYARLFAGLPEIFVWGIDHGAIYKAMAATGGGNPRLLIDYLRDAGVQYLIGRTGAMRSFAQMHPQDFRLVAQTNTIFVYQVTDSAPEMETPRDKPVAWIDADAFAGRSSETPASFLMHAAAVRNALPGLPRMVRMTEGRALNTPEQRRLFS
ncbi:MAG: hypothetical protein HY042_09215, partial [Spirochaetia bacterium]|nr:hypothetical protein [Spirochaetia bacterium]